MAQLDIAKPARISKYSLVGGLLAGYVEPDAPACNLNGTPTFNWLLELDPAAATLRSGGAKPVSDPVTGYAFVNGAIDGLPVAPATWTGVTPDASGCLATPTGQDLVMPVYLDTAASDALLLPFRGLRFTEARLSASQSCIGQYNPARDVAAGCVADDSHPGFLDRGSIEALITLEDADTVPISALQVTLCVLLTADAGAPGPGGLIVCTRDANGKIVKKGDACSTGTGCGDAFTFQANFAASSVKIN